MYSILFNLFVQLLQTLFKSYLISLFIQLLILLNLV